MKAGKTKAKSWAPAITSVDLENIVAAKGPASWIDGGCDGKVGGESGHDYYPKQNAF